MSHNYNLIATSAFNFNGEVFGGYVRSLFNKEEISDLDVYFSERNHFMGFVLYLLERGTLGMVKKAGYYDVKLTTNVDYPSSANMALYKLSFVFEGFTHKIDCIVGNKKTDVFVGGMLDFACNGLILGRNGIRHSLGENFFHGAIKEIREKVIHPLYVKEDEYKIRRKEKMIRKGYILA